MNLYFKQLWLGALRSGEYEQHLCRGRTDELRSCYYGPYNALGVLAEICEVLDSVGSVTTLCGDRFEFSLPTWMTDQIGITGEHHGEIVKMSRYASFAEIADWIEENL